MTRMKESGIDWIGQIPEEWEVGRVKDFYKFFSGFTPDTSNVDYYGDVNDYVWVTIADMKSKEIKNSKQTLSELFVLKKYPQISKAGSLLYSFKLSVGKVAFASIDLYTNEAIATFENTPNINLKFLYYSSYLIEFNSETNIYGAKLLNSERIRNAYIVQPPLSEQTKIANFLDKKTAQLDKAKRLLEKQIQKLKDYRASLIYETVTKGLDQTVPMKDSGIDWIGQVPEGWGVIYANHIFVEHKQKNRGNIETNLLSLSYGRIIKKSIESSFGLLPESFDTYNTIQKGDIVLRLTDLQNDKRSLRVGLAREKGIITSAYLTLRLKYFECSATYMYYLLHSYDICKLFYNFGGGVRQGGTWSDFYKTKLLLPSHNEQVEIVEFLNKKTCKIDKLIQNKQKQIENIVKQRQTLIYDYVTGKRRV